MSNQTNQQIVKGIVTEALPNTMFRVATTVDGVDCEVLATLAGKMRLHRIKVLIGDTVEVVLDGYGNQKGRIVKRF